MHPNLYVLTIQLLARYERYAELGLYVINKVLALLPSMSVWLKGCLCNVYVGFDVNRESCFVTDC